MIVAENLKKLPVSDTHNCFGCSPVNSSGLQMEFYASDETVVSYITVPEHLCGWSNLAHGGVTSTIMDEIMSWAALYLLKKMLLTKNINVDFVRPVFINTPMRAEGYVKEVISDREAIMEGVLYNDKDEICAKSTGIFALFTLETVKKMGFVSQESIKEFEFYMNM